MQLTEGSCDLLIAYHHASQPLQLSTDRYEMLSLGHETLAAYAKADDEGRPMFELPSPNGHKVPFLSYASGAYLGRLVELIAKLSPVPLNLDPIYETDMAEGLKAMALEGHGLAFLPNSSVKKELKSKRLVRAAAPGTLVGPIASVFHSAPSRSSTDTKVGSPPCVRRTSWRLRSASTRWPSISMSAHCSSV